MLRHGDGHRPETKLRAIERLGATIVKATYDECWHTVEQHGSDRMHGHFVHPFDDDRLHQRQRTIGLEILEDLPDVDAIVAPLGGGGLLAGIGAACARCGPDVKVYAAEPETAAPLATSLSAPAGQLLRGWTPSFVDGAGGRSVLPTMWPLLRSLVDGSIVVPLDEAAQAMRTVAERVHVIAEGRRRAPSPRRCRRRWPRAATRRSSRSCRAATSTSSRFAPLVGACVMPVDT